MTKQFTAKCPNGKKSHGEVSLRRSVLTPKYPYGEVSVRRSIPTEKCPTVKCPTAKIPTAKSPVTLLKTGFNHKIYNNICKGWLYPCGVTKLNSSWAPWYPYMYSCVSACSSFCVDWDAFLFLSHKVAQENQKVPWSLSYPIYDFFLFGSRLAWEV